MGIESLVSIVVASVGVLLAVLARRDAARARQVVIDVAMALSVKGLQQTIEELLAEKVQSDLVAIRTRLDKLEGR